MKSAAIAHKFLGGAVTLIALGSAAASVVALSPNVPVMRQISRGEVHSYTLPLVTGQYALICIDQRDIDLSLTLASPEENTRQTWDPAAFGRECMSVVATSSGPFQIEVATAKRTTARGHYQLRLFRPRRLRPEDAKRIRAQELFMAGLGSANENTVESLSRAVTLFNEAAYLWHSVMDHRHEAYAISRVATVHHRTGKWEDARRAYLQTLRLLNVETDAFLRLDVVRGLAAVEGQMRRSTRYLNVPKPAELLAFWRRMGDRRGIASALTDIGIAYGRAGDNQKHLQYCTKALDLYQVLGDRHGEASSLEEMGKAYSALKDYHKATEFHRRRLEIVRELEDRRGEAAALGDLGVSLEFEGCFDTAVESLKQSMALRHEMGDTTSEMELLFHLGATFTMKGDYVQSLAWLKQCIELTESFRTSLASPTSRASLGERRYDDLYVRNLMILHGQRPEHDFLVQAFESADSSRGRFIVDPLNKVEPVRLADIQRELLNNETLLLEYWLGIDKSYLWLVTPSQIEVFTLPSRNEINKQAALVYDCLVARNRQPPGESIGHRAARVARADRMYLSAAPALSRILIGPIASQLGGKRLLIVGDGVLQYLPFAALPDSAGVPLLATHELINIPSAWAAVEMQRDHVSRLAAKGLLALLADPVFDLGDSRVGRVPRHLRPRLAPDLARATRAVGLARPGAGIPRLAFASREARDILAIAPPAQTWSLLDFEATRDAVLDERLSDYRVLHIAAHGFVNNDDPDLSGIVLSLIDRRGRPREGFLRLRDVYALELHSDLVVLSACDTALGKVIFGQSLVGLTGGFLRAGAARVVSTTWKIDDESTAEIMKAFYRAMWGPQHLTPAAALHAAQLSVRSQDRWNAPYYWAGFMLHGQWR